MFSPSAYPQEAAIEWLAVARAVVPGVSATTLALIESHTLTTVSRVGSRCRRSSSAALFSRLSWALSNSVICRP